MLGMLFAVRLHVIYMYVCVEHVLSLPIPGYILIREYISLYPFLNLIIGKN